MNQLQILICILLLSAGDEGRALCHISLGTLASFGQPLYSQHAVEACYDVDLKFQKKFVTDNLFFSSNTSQERDLFLQGFFHLIQGVQAGAKMQVLEDAISSR